MTTDIVVHKTCAESDCDRQRHGLKQICQYHYNRFRLAQMPRCSIEGCERKQFAGEQCQTHYSRTLKHGDPHVVLVPKVHRGTEHWKWTETPTYGGIHLRVRATLGAASNYICIRCPKTAQQWAYRHTDPNERIDALQGLPYSTSIKYYSPMCVPCHKTFDLNRMESNHV